MGNITEKELRRAFAELDRDSDGFLSESDLASSFQALGDTFEPDLINEMIAEVCSKGTGSIDYEDFREIMSP